MGKTVTFKELGELVNNSYDPQSLQHNFHRDDMIDRVKVPDNNYIDSYYTPLIFKTHLPLFSPDMIAFVLMKLYYGCGYEHQKGASGLALTNGGWMSNEQTGRVLNQIIQSNLIYAHYDNPKAFIAELDKIDKASDLKIVNHLMRASHTRYALQNNPDYRTAVRSEIKMDNEHILQEFVLNDTKPTADLIMVAANTIPLWNTEELFLKRATAPDNKNMSVVFANFSINKGMEGNVIFYDEHDLKNWLFFHRHILRRVFSNESSDISRDTISFAADLLEAMDEDPKYDEFTPLAMTISSLANGRILFINDRTNFKNKLKLLGSISQFIYRFINSGD